MLDSIFSRLQKLKIQQQLLLLVLLSAVIPASAVGVLGVFSATGTLSANAKSALQEEVGDEIEEIDAFLESVTNDILFISNLPPIQGMVRARANGGTDPQDNSTYDAWVGQLQAIFTTKMEEKSYFMQLRFLDEAGDELVRVDSVNGQVTVIPDAQLQNKSDRDYFNNTMTLSVGDIYVSQLNLNQENGVIAEPYTPVMRYATPIEDEAGQPRGMVVANIFASTFLNDFADTNTIFQGEELVMVNQDGHYLAHPNPDKLWGFDLDSGHILTDDFSPAIAEEILNNDVGIIDVGRHIIAYHRLVPSSNQPYALIAFNQVPKGSIFASVHSFEIFASLAVLISLGLVIPLAIFRGRQLVMLMEKLTAGISTSSQEMATTITEQERIASQQAASVNETTTTMDELEASSRHAAEQAGAAVVAAKRAFQASEEGSEAVSEGMEGMFALEKKVEAIAEQIVTLSSRATQIGSIAQLVVDFANQTNMLALNSSVEAVRAGEHGKGFAVVANEIRKLSDQSQQSADKINVIVSDIQKSINETVMVTDEGTKTVKMGVDIAKRTEKAFGEVQSSVNQVVLNNQQVSLNLKQQVDAIQQVVSAMEIINRGAKETATGLNQTKATTDQLKDAAVDLQQII